MGAPDGLDDGLATAVGHVDVDEDDVGEPLADELDGRAHLVGVPDHLDRVPELGPHPGQEEMVVVDQEHAHLGPVALASGAGSAMSLTTCSRPGHDQLDLGPLSRRAADDRRPPWRVIRARMDSAIPLRSPSTASGSKPWPRSRTKTDTCVGSTSTKSDTLDAPDHLAALTVASRPAAQQRPQLRGQLAVAHRHRVHRHTVARLDIAFDHRHGLGHRRHLTVERPRGPALEQPGPQLALLGPGQARHLALVPGGALDERQGLEHRVVHGGGHVGALLVAHPLAPLDRQVAGQAQPPRAEDDQEPDDDDVGGEDGLEGGRGGMARRHQVAEADDHEGRTHHDATRPWTAGCGARATR